MSRPSIPPQDLLIAAPGRKALGSLSHPLPAGMRDLLPAESEAQRRLSSSVLGTFDLHGYQQVNLPAFEYAEVLERGLGTIDPASLLRFVEPETGEVVALRPDMTPQVARLVSTRLAERSVPARLSYRGSVLRRQHERARHDQQMLQAGIELIGTSGTAADLEVISVCIAAVRGAGLHKFVLDLGHGGIAQALLADVSEELRATLLESLSLKDGAELVRRCQQLQLAEQISKPLVGLVNLSGGADVFERARGLLESTAAWPAVEELRALYEALQQQLKDAAIVVDLGETRGAAYYTGPIFQILAEGPGQAVASGGRYDALYGLFGAPRPAAGCAIQLDHLRWALGDSSVTPRMRAVVVPAAAGGSPQAVLAALREAKIPCVLCEEESALDYAQAWRYSHVLRVAADGASVAAVRLDGTQESDLGQLSLIDLKTGLSAI